MVKQAGHIEKNGGRERGQIVALFAISLAALVAVLGLIFDGGNFYVQRRTAQNAADAGALAGTRALMNAPTSPDTTVADAVCKYLTANVFGTIPTATAVFVDTSGSAVSTNLLPANCSGSVSNVIPGTAAGVKVDASIGPFQTYVAGIVGIRQATATGTSTVQGAAVAAVNADNAPFIICGINTRLALPAVGNYSILTGGPGTYAIDPLAFGKTFVIHSTVASGIEQCGDSTWHGLADMTANGNNNVANLDLATTPVELATTRLFGAQSTANNVDGFSGCAAGGAITNCVMLIPIATGSSGGLLTDKHCVYWAAFLITQSGATKHNARLLNGYSVGVGPESFTWNWGARLTTSIVSMGATH
jgi:Flp pilus assembly protein TadG